MLSLHRDINRTVWGVDLVEEHLLGSCGLPARPLIARRPLANLAEYSINAPITGGYIDGLVSYLGACQRCCSLQETAVS
jgi:carnosine synthase